MRTKKTIKIFAAMAMVLAVTSSGLWAQEKKEEKTVVDIYTSVYSSYFFRGTHVFSNATKEFDKTKGEFKEDSAFPLAPAIQPGFTLYTPIEGLIFDVWSSFAASKRKSAETKEDGDTVNSLNTLDEVDYLVKYSFENRIGSFSLFYLTYSLPNTAGSQFTEIGFSYTAKLPLSPTLSVANDVNKAYTYVSLAVSHEVKISDSMSLTPGLTYGYSREHSTEAHFEKGYMQFDLPFVFTTGKLAIKLAPGAVYQLDKDKKPSVQGFVGLGATYSL